MEKLEQYVRAYMKLQMTFYRGECQLQPGQMWSTIARPDAHEYCRDYSVCRSVCGPSEGIIEIARLFNLESSTKSRLKNRCQSKI